VTAVELGLARQVVDGLAGGFEPTEVRSEYRQNLRGLLEAKLETQAIARAQPAGDEPVVADLMEALRASVAAAAEKRAKPGSRKKTATRKRTAAK
jgi:DNA end-binding protein Ku